MRHQPPPINRDRARGMRRDPTRAEDMLWEALRGRRLEGAKFRRQVPLAHFILDFVCFQRRLIVEVDGWMAACGEPDGRCPRHLLPVPRYSGAAFLERGGGGEHQRRLPADPGGAPGWRRMRLVLSPCGRGRSFSILASAKC